MPFDSLVRTKQLNKPELSGYVVDVLLQYLKSGQVTGIAMNTGTLTGAFYPLRQNPSGYVTTGQVTGYATFYDITGNNTNLLSYVNTNYYPRANPSGYASTGSNFPYLRVDGTRQDNKPIWIYEGNFDVDVIKYLPDYEFVLNAFLYGSKILLGDSVGTRAYITGFDIYANNINGYPAMSSSDMSGRFVTWDYFTEDKALNFPYLHLDYGDVSEARALYFDSANFVIVGNRIGYDETHVIDYIGSLGGTYGRTTNRPYILGFDIDAYEIKSSGYRVLTSNDATGYATKSMLLGTSGLLDLQNWQTYTDVWDHRTGTPSRWATANNKQLTGDITLLGVNGTNVYYQDQKVLIDASTSSSLMTNLVYTTGDQTIQGVKSFVNGISGHDNHVNFPAFGWLASTDTTDSVFRLLSSDGNSLAVDVNARTLNDINGSPVLNWKRQQLTGTWATNNLSATSSLSVGTSFPRALISELGGAVGQIRLASDGTRFLYLSFDYENYPVLSCLNFANGLPDPFRIHGNPLCLNPGAPTYGGNVGIGTLVPQSLLDVNGDTRIGGTLSVTGRITVSGVPVSTGQAAGVSSISVTGVNLLGIVGITGIGGLVVTTSGGNKVVISGGLSINTGSFITTGQTGQFVGTGVTGQFVSSTALNNYGVKGISGFGGTTVISGLVGVTGVTNVSTIFSGNVIWISGQSTGSLVGQNMTGILVGINQTGQFVGTGVTGQFASLTALNNYGVKGISGYGGSTVISGVVGITGITNIVTVFSGNMIWVSGQSTGNLVGREMTGILVGLNQTGLFYAASNPAGYITSASAGVQAISGFGGSTVISGMVGITGVTNVTTVLSGKVIWISGQSTGNLVGREMTGILVGVNQTGLFYASSNPAGYVTSASAGVQAISGFGGSTVISGMVGVTGVTNVTTVLSGKVIWISGQSTGNLVGREMTGILVGLNQTGLFYASANPAGYISGQSTGNLVGREMTGILVGLNQTGLFYASANPAGYISGQSTGNLVGREMTGILVGLNQTGLFYASANPLGYITSAQAGGVSSILVTGKNVSGVIGMTGVGGAIVFLSGTTICISGGASNVISSSDSGILFFRSGISSGKSSQFINFPAVLDSKPIVIATMHNDASSSILGHQISGANTTGFWAIFSATVRNTGYYFDVMAANSTGTGMASNIIINNNTFFGGGGVNYLTVDGVPLSGNITLNGLSGVAIYANGNTIYFSGSGGANVNTGSLASQAYVQAVSGDISVRLNQTGQTLIGMVGESTAGVSSINTVTGILTLSGYGNITVSNAGTAFKISGYTGTYANFIGTGQTGLFYAASNPAGYISGLSTGNLVGREMTGILVGLNQTGLFYPFANPAGYITSAQAGGVSSISVTGKDISGVVGVIGVGGIAISTSGTSVVVSGGLSVNTGSFVTTGQTGQFVGISQTGFVASQSYVQTVSGDISTRLNQTGQTLIGMMGGQTAGVSSINTITGILTLSGYGNITVSNAGTAFKISGDTGAYANFLTTSNTGTMDVDKLDGQHGVYYLNLANHTGVLAGTGTFITTGQTGFIASQSYVQTVSGDISVRLNQTGQTLIGMMGGEDAGVSSINTVTGILTLSGYGNITISNAGTAFKVSGDTGAYANFVGIGQTGLFYASSNPAGYITSAQAAGVNNILVTGYHLSGEVGITGFGGVMVYTSGTTVVISGGSSSTSSSGGVTGIIINTNAAMTGEVHFISTSGIGVSGDGSNNISFYINDNPWKPLTWASTVVWSGDRYDYEDRRTLETTGQCALAISGLYNGWAGILRVRQAKSGACGLTLPAGAKVVNGGSGQVTLTTGISGAIDVLGFQYDGTYLLVNIGNTFN